MVSSSAPRYVYSLGPGRTVSRIVFSYQYSGPAGTAVTYTVVPMHGSTVYLTVFPPWFREVYLGSLRSYSWHDYPWRDAPWGLEIMVRTEGCYVEE